MYSGWVFWLANARRLDAKGLGLLQVNAVRRAVELLTVNVLMLLVVCAMMAAMRFQVSGAISAFWDVLLAPPGSWLSNLSHLATPLPVLFTFDILPMYALLLLVAPAGVYLMRHCATGWVLGLSGALYALACFGPLDRTLLGFEQEGFNPFAWQVIFVLGMVGGRRGWFCAPPPYWLAPGVVAILALGLGWALSHRYPIHLGGLPKMPDLPLTGHADIGLLPILHLFAMMTVVAWVWHAASDRLRHAAVASLGAVGRHGLMMYAVGNVFQFAAISLLGALGPAPAANLAVSGGLTTALVGFARWRNKRRRGLTRMVAAALAPGRRQSA